jgi:hypothetical protein
MTLSSADGSNPPSLGLSSIGRGMAWGLRLFLGALLVYSGLVKLYDPIAFLDIVYKYELVGERGGIIAALLIPIIELSVGASLVAGSSRAGAMTAFALLLLFAAAQTSAWMRGLAIDCGCFSGSANGNLVGPWTIARTSLLGAVALAVLTLERTPQPVRTDERVT